MNILAVDDKQDILTLVKTILEIDGHTVITADTGSKAVALCNKTRFPVILLDLMMEGMDGFETLKEIRKTTLNSASTVIALTAKAYEHDRKIVLDSGFNDHFSKPFRAMELSEKIKQYS